MIKKKATTKSTAQKRAKKSAKKKLKKETNPAEVRKQVSRIVEAEATLMTRAVVDEAKKGQLAPVRYLFEMANIFPAQANPDTATEEEDCLAKILLSRMEAPAKPEKEDEDELNSGEEAATTAVVSDPAEGVKKEAAQVSVGIVTSVT
jgi:hypothetical protein